MTAKQLTDSILQLAIQGKLVPQDSNDEPASVLLDKIREEKRRLVKEGVLKKKDIEEIPVDEEPFPIPDNWEWTTISNIFIINPKVIGEDSQNAAFIPMEKIEAGYSSNYTFEVRKWGEIRKSFTNFADGDVAFAKITPCFQNRKSVIFSGLPNGIGAGTTELKVLRPIGNTIDRKFLLYFLKSQYFIKEAKFKGTANQQRIVVGYLENKYFPLPPLAEQHRIVERIEEILPIVKEYGEAYEEASKMDASLPEMLKKSILQEAIMGNLGTQDDSDEPASKLLEQIREEKKRLVKEGILKKKDLEETPITEEEKYSNIPENWVWVRIGQVADFINGLAFKPDEWEDTGLPIIRIQNLTDMNRPFNYTSKIFDDKFKVRKGDLLFSWSATLDSFIWEGDEAWLNQHIFRVNPYNCIDKYYLYYLLKGIVTSLSSITHGLTMKHLTRGAFEGYAFPLPPLAEQHRIVKRVKELFAEIDNMTINKDINETEIEETEE